MINAVALSIIITQTAIAVYLFNTLKLKNNFEKYLNAILVILFFHLGTKLFFLVGLKNTLLYSKNASGFSLSYGPLLYIITTTYVRKWLPRKVKLMHLLPFVICTLIYFVNCAGCLGHALPSSFMITYSAVYQWVMIVSMTVYPFLSLRELKKHTGADETIAMPGVRLLRQFAIVLLAGIATGVGAVIYYLIKTGHVFDMCIVIHLYLAAMPVLILRYKMQILGTTATAPVKQSAAESVKETINIISQHGSIINVPVHEEIAANINIAEKKYTKSGVDEKMLDKYEEALKLFMKKTKIYLEPEISLEQLAAKTNIPKHHLTQLLNERFGKNFYTFINEHRITEAMEKLQHDRNLNILSLAYDCGFNSKSSFNTYFKKVTGLTPSAYRKEHNPSHMAEAEQMA